MLLARADPRCPFKFGVEANDFIMIVQLLKRRLWKRGLNGCFLFLFFMLQLLFCPELFSTAGIFAKFKHEMTLNHG
jgi:hypothetical protein